MASFSAVCTRITNLISRTSVYYTTRPFSICSYGMPSCCVPINPSPSHPFQFSCPTSLLTPTSVQVIPAAGMKQKGKVRRRCKHCFFIMIDERLHVWCDVHARHKQMQMIQKPKTLMKLTHATQGKIRPW